MNTTLCKLASRHLPRVHETLRCSFAFKETVPCSQHARSFSTTTYEEGTKSVDAATKTDTEADLQTSLFKNPIVRRLWTERQKVKQSKLLVGETAAKTRVEIPYNFSTDKLLLESYRNFQGQIRMGRMLEDLDALAGNIAFFHVHNARKSHDEDYPVIVTASVDRIRLKRQPLAQNDQLLSGQVSWTGRSAMEIKMTCSENGEDWLEAFVTYVTLNPYTLKSTPTPPIIPETPSEKKDFEEGQARADFKKRLRQQKKDKNDQMTLKVEELAQSLFEESLVLQNLPSLADPSHILMDQTYMSNSQIAQPQAQNLHNRIFGGFLMRRAFELAYANTYVFAGAKPIFLEVDQVSFTKPVDVGDLIQFHSRVLYTDKGCSTEFYQNFTPEEQHDMQLVHIEVEAWVTIPEEARSVVSNQFYFTLAVSKNEGQQPSRPLRRILPNTLDQARRMATRMVADEAQRKHDNQKNK